MKRWMIVLALVAGCSPSASPDAGHDAGATDAGSTDVGVSDGGHDASDAGPGGFETCFDGTSGTGEIPLDRLRFVAPDGTEVHLARIWEAQGPGFSSIYGIRGLAVRHGGSEECITAASSLGYENTHHNWYDEATATGEHDYQLAMDIVLDSAPLSGELTLSIDGGTPIDLTYDGCTTAPAEAMERGCFFFLPPS